MSWFGVEEIESLKNRIIKWKTIIFFVERKICNTIFDDCALIDFFPYKFRAWPSYPSSSFVCQYFRFVSKRIRTCACRSFTTAPFVTLRILFVRLITNMAIIIWRMRSIHFIVIQILYHNKFWLVRRNFKFFLNLIFLYWHNRTFHRMGGVVDLGQA